MEIKKVLIIFKTHLDIGFTDLAKNVKQKYFDVFIPSALKTAADLKQMHSDVSFKWTTGSWLISEYLREFNGTEKGEQLKKAIKNGDICWHALPCTTHTEIMTKALFEYGLSLSKNLDMKFGVNTIAAKMTDVPGHTKSMIPILAENGVELLHIGVNPASAVPDVPEIFNWQHDDGSSVTVIYNGEYGNFTPLGNTGVALYFAHTNDNLGSQTAQEVIETFEMLKKTAPGAELVAADLNDAALVLRQIKDSLPTVTSEIGDSWIHGAATDPKKQMQFRALCRFWESMPDSDDKEILARGLLMVPEHTWGLDEKTHLHDEENFSKESFKKHKNDANFKKMESSWEEQRRFLYDAVASLSSQNKEICEKLLSEYKREPVSTEGYSRILPGAKYVISGYTVGFDKSGAISFLSKDGKTISDASHLLCKPLYEVFSYDNYVTFHKRYHRIEDDWAWQDFTKIGMDNAVKEYESFGTTADIFINGNSAVVKFRFPEKATELYGAPHSAEVFISFSDDAVDFDFAWFNKDENRIAEALWLGFAPLAHNKKISKLSRLIDPKDVVSRGNRGLHATDSGVYYDEIDILSTDAALVSPSYPCVLDYPNTFPKDEDGIYFGLHNNLWGTNFPMWYGEDARFRFRLIIK